MNAAAGVKERDRQKKRAKNALLELKPVGRAPCLCACCACYHVIYCCCTYIHSNDLLCLSQLVYRAGQRSKQDMATDDQTAEKIRWMLAPQIAPESCLSSRGWPTPILSCDIMSQARNLTHIGVDHRCACAIKNGAHEDNSMPHNRRPAAPLTYYSVKRRRPPTCRAILLCNSRGVSSTTNII